MTRVYVGAPYGCRDSLRDRLKAMLPDYIYVTSRWLKEQHPIGDGSVGAAARRPLDEVRADAAHDLMDLDAADVAIFLTAQAAQVFNELDASHSHTGGRHVETGYALGLGIPVLVVGAPENIFQRGLCINCHSLAEAVDLIVSGEVVDAWVELRGHPARPVCAEPNPRNTSVRAACSLRAGHEGPHRVQWPNGFDSWNTAPQAPIMVRRTPTVGGI